MTAASWYDADTDEHAPRLVSGVGVVSQQQREAAAVEYDSTRHRLAPGTHVGDHLIIRGVLGEGGTAVVYEALHTRLGASVAVKVVDVSEEYMEGARARLLREAHVCASLEDPHVPRVYDVGALDDGTPYVVMERVSGRTLEDVLLQGSLPLEVAVQVAEDLLQAVEAIEKAGIVHRDIKPPNIILQTNSEGTLRVRLMDFGVSKTLTADPDPTMQSNPKLTQQGAIVGTPHYMAPEQIVGPTVDTRADLYAVGVVAYEMMGGRTPFEGQTTGEVVAAVLHTRPLPLGKLRKVHPELEGWVERAMAQRRSNRFASAREMREALREAWLEHRAWEQSTGRRKWMRRVPLLAALGLVGVGLAMPRQLGYDLSSITSLLSGRAPNEQAATPVESTTTAPAAAAATPAAAHDVAVAPTATAEGQLPGESTQELPLGAVPEEQPAALPQSEPPRAADAAEDAAALQGGAAQAPVAAPEQPAAPSIASTRPKAAAAPVARPGLGARPAPTATQPAREPTTPAARGVLLNDYLRQLDDQLAPQREPQREEPQEKRPGQVAPNPFDRLPDNPYSH